MLVIRLTVRHSNALQKIGYGDIATDAQRQQSLLEYAQHRIPPHLYDIVRGSGELIAILEQSQTL